MDSCDHIIHALKFYMTLKKGLYSTVMLYSLAI